ncbi:MAG TPA: hypothetical protein VHU84_11865 [Lacipirellulaceae bacterium]|nr:hypothetical protein [Lacipirellulaceae bacterium]
MSFAYQQKAIVNMSSDASSSLPIGSTRGWMVVGLTIVAVGISLVFWWVLRGQAYDPDSKHYIAIAEGRIAEVHKPFTSRLLQPAIAGGISRATGLSLDTSFFLTNLVSLVVLTSIGLILVLSQVRSVWLAAAIVVSPLIFGRFREIYLPDCMHAAIAAIFFLLLVRGARLFATPLLFFLQVIRESTALLTFVTCIVAVYHRKWKLAAGAALFTVLGMVVVGRYASQGQGNIHNMNTVVYLVTKVPFNFFTNVCGVCIWTDTHAKNDPEAYPNEPVWKHDLPTWVPTGSTRQVGVYKLDPSVPLAHLRFMLTTLGVMPSVVLAVLLARRRQLLRDDAISEVGLIALVYGTLAFLMSPILGTSVGRYLTYAWPLAWIAAPELVRRYFGVDERLITKLAWLQVTASWISLALLQRGVSDVPRNLVAIVVAGVCHVVAFKMMRQQPIAAAA